MRPQVPPSIALAVAVAAGAAAAAGALSRPHSGVAGGASGPPGHDAPGEPELARAAAFEGGFFAPTPRLLRAMEGLAASAPGAAGLERAPAPVSDIPQSYDGYPDGEYHEFFFTRAIYSSGGGRRGGWYGGGRGGGSWRTDFPKADVQYLTVINRLIDIDAYDRENAVGLDDPNLRRFPFLYALEVGSMRLTDAEREGLRGYLEAGGFLVIDDFWGDRQWANFEYEIRQVLPDREIVELTTDHPLFNMVYDIDEIVQVPGVDRRNDYRVTHQGDNSETPWVLGIHDDEGRLMVVINFNTDLGDAWEWAEQPYYPLHFSTYAFQVGMNQIVYGMSH